MQTPAPVDVVARGIDRLTSCQQWAWLCRATGLIDVRQPISRHDTSMVAGPLLRLLIDQFRGDWPAALRATLAYEGHGATLVDAVAAALADALDSTSLPEEVS